MNASLKYEASYVLTQQRQQHIFQKWRCLRELELPNTLERIQSYCFSGSNLRQITIAPGVRELGEFTFMNCTQLECVTFAQNSSLTTICEGAFFGSGIVDFVAPPSLKEIKAIAFFNCEKLQSVTLNKSLEVIEENCF